MTITGHGAWRYQWIDNWARIPDTPSGRDNGRTHGVVVTRDGNVIVFNQADPAVLIFDTDGRQIGAWGDRFRGAHGMTLVEEDGRELLWLTDEHSGEVVKTSLDGETLLSIPQPEHDAYRDGSRYRPTWVAVNEVRHGGNGDIWVADGYGASLVHRYDRQGRYIGAISGQKGAGRFACPHGIAFDYRRGQPELYVADRGNARIQVFDAEGNFRRVAGARTLHSPCMFSFLGELCLVPELYARVDILDGDDQLVAALGDNGYTTTIPGWPDHHRMGHPDRIAPGRFNSPHAAAFAPNGDIYVVEWLIGGRITKLKKM